MLSEKPIVTFANNPVFMTRLLYITKLVWSHVLAL